MAEILTEQIEALKQQQQQKQHGSKQSSKDSPAQPQAAGTPGNGTEKKQSLPKGVVLDKDGKPCRTCTSIADWRALTRMKSPALKSLSSSSALTTPAYATTTSDQIPPDCPPDVEALGRSTWTLLHSMTATYPERASPEQQKDMGSFLSLFSKLYPCWVCADDFRSWMNEPTGRNTPRLKSRSEFGNWMCEAHNEVNRKLGKKEFDCSKWEERWRTGWNDGRCD